MPLTVNFNSSTASTDHDKTNLFNLYFSTIHLVYLILMSYLTLLGPLMLLTLVLLMHTKLLYHRTLINPLALIILGQECCITVLKHFVNLFTTYHLYHYAMQLYLHAGKFIRWFLYLKPVILTLSQITIQFPSYLIHQRHLTFKSRIATSYKMFDNSILLTNSDKVLGLVLSTDVS